VPDASPDASEDNGVAALAAEELKAKQTGDAAPFELVSFNPEIMAKVQRIRAAHDAIAAEEYGTGKPSTIESDPSDVEAVIKYAASLPSGDSQCPVCDFMAQSHLLTMVIDLLPSGYQLERAISAQIGYLSFNPAENDDPVAWLMEMRHLINISRTPTEEAKHALAAQAKKGPEWVTWGLPSAETDAIRNLLRSSPDPIVAAYMLAEEVLKTPYLTPEQLAQAK